jgi:hypothetical protein
MNLKNIMVQKRRQNQGEEETIRMDYHKILTDLSEEEHHKLKQAPDSKKAAKVLEVILASRAQRDKEALEMRTAEKTEEIGGKAIEKRQAFNDDYPDFAFA